MRIRRLSVAGIALLALALGGGLFLPPASAQPAVPPAAPGAAPAVSSPHLTGVELSAPVQQALQQLQEQWLQFATANNRERAGQVVEGLLATSRQLGMQRLPDLSLGALVQAVRAARRGDFRHARWALDAAERLDPDRPETAFAEASVDRLRGKSVSALVELARGYQRLFWLPPERYLWGQDLLLWSLCLLLFTGGLFVAVEMATKGGALYRDLFDFLARRIPRGASHAVAIALLLWPLALPLGTVWLLLYWSLLVWGYASTSERAVLIALWLLLGSSPFLLAEQRRQVTVMLSPPVQAMESLEEGRLYGGLFTDLGVLRSILPESPAVKQLLADFHRRLNQWDLARSLYRQVLEREPNNASVLLDLGDYFFFKGDFGNAIQHYQKAAAADPSNAAAQFNLSQAYSDSYLFDESKRALAQAHAIDDARVDGWLRHADQQRVVVGDGGMARIAEIRRQLFQSWQAEAPSPRLELFRRGLSLALALSLILLAVALHLGRRAFGYTEPPLELRFGTGTLARWLRVLLPGVSSAEAGEGGRVFLALLVPAALLTVPLLPRLGYRIPWGYDPGELAPWIVTSIGLLAYLGARVRWELRNQL